MAGVGEAGETKTEGTTCLAEVLGAVLALASEKGTWVSEVPPEGMPMTGASTLSTLVTGPKTSCEMCGWSVAFKSQPALHSGNTNTWVACLCLCLVACWPPGYYI